MLKKLKGLFVEEEGQGMAEYGLILGLIAVVVIGVLTLLGTQLKTLFTNLKDSISGVSGTASTTTTTTTP